MPLAPTSRGRLHATIALTASLVLLARHDSNVIRALVGLTSFLAAAAWFFPRTYAPVQRALDGAVQFLLKAFTWLLLGIVYFGIFTPMRGFRDLTRKDPLGLKRPRETSYFSAVSPASSGRFDRQF